jgi:RimJ/RimL family protein N-acetyltransferase
MVCKVPGPRRYRDGDSIVEHTTFEQLDSPRLWLRRFRTTDAEALARYRNDPDVARLQAWDVPYTRVQAERFIESLANVSPGRPGAWFQFAVVLRADGVLIGDCALRTTRTDPRQAELGFSFATPYQRHGYACEAVHAVLHYVFTTLGMHRVFSITDTRNQRAQRLLERTAFRHEGHFVENTWFKGEWSSEFLYAQLASEWQTSSTRQIESDGIVRAR